MIRQIEATPWWSWLAFALSMTLLVWVFIVGTRAYFKKENESWHNKLLNGLLHPKVIAILMLGWLMAFLWLRPESFEYSMLVIFLTPLSVLAATALAILLTKHK